MKDIRELKDILKHVHQDHVLRFWDDLNSESQEKLFKQLSEIDFKQIETFKTMLAETGQKADPLHMEPAEVVPLPQNDKEAALFRSAKNTGEEALKAGKVGVFLVAGGQGTRLGYNGPKGTYPVGPVSGRSLFQIHAEKILAAGRAYEVSIPWYIMTSQANHLQTELFFKKNNYFGLSDKEVFFIRQKMLPALDPNGKLILSARDSLAMSPNGHGGALLAMKEGGVLSDCRKRGIEVLSYFQVDNVLVNIIDPVFIGFHLQADAEMSSKMIRKRDAYEKVGHFGTVDGRLRVVEYSDMTEEDMTAKNPDGSLKYNAGSVAIHLINPAFVEKEVEGGLKLPYHIAHKKIPVVNENGETVSPDTPNGYKFETFIFEALTDTECTIILESRREEEFSPVKNREGEDSPFTAKRDMSNYFGEWLEAKGIAVPRNSEGHVQGMIEINPLYARTKEEFLQKSDLMKFEDGLYLE